MRGMLHSYQCLHTLHHCQYLYIFIYVTCLIHVWQVVSLSMPSNIHTDDMPHSHAWQAVFLSVTRIFIHVTCLFEKRGMLHVYQSPHTSTRATRLIHLRAMLHLYQCLLTSIRVASPLVFTHVHDILHVYQCPHTSLRVSCHLHTCGTLYDSERLYTFIYVTYQLSYPFICVPYCISTNAFIHSHV